MLQPKKFHQLFLDDGAVESSERITRRLHPAQEVRPPDNRAECRAATPRSGTPTSRCGSGGTSAAPSATRPPRTGNTGTCPTSACTSGRDRSGTTWPRTRTATAGNGPTTCVRDDADPGPQAALQGSSGHLGPAAGAVARTASEWTPTGAPSIPSSDESQFTWDPVQPAVPGDGQAGDRMGALGLPVD